MRKSFLTILALVVAMSTLPACSSKKSGKSTRIARGGAYADNHYQNQPGANSQTGEWGVIYNGSNSMNSILASFMPGADLGNVSGMENDNTGMRLRGQARQGSSIDILVWDDMANQGLDPFLFSFSVVSVVDNQTTATIVAQDAFGEITLNGNFQNGEYRGTISFSNEDGSRGTLGNFAIEERSLF